MKTVLFVDDEAQVRDGLKRMLHRLRKEWSMEFATNGREALRLLGQSEFDVLVTDVRMPEMDGIALLSEARRLFPQTVRIVLSGIADQELTLRSVSLAHQYLMKPCDAQMLQETLDKAFALRNLLDQPALTRLIGSIKSLPSAPTVYLKLMDALRSDDVSAAQIGSIIGEDLGMAAKVLQLVNSPLFGSRRAISTPEEATVYIGVETVRALVLAEGVFSKFGPANHPGFSPEQLREHSVRVAVLARRLATSWGLAPSVVGDVFVGGLLHDIGKLVLGSNYPREYQEVTACFDDSEALREVERRLFGTSHAEVGGYLLWLWGVPGRAAEIVSRHHISEPDTSGNIEPATAILLADQVVRASERPSKSCSVALKRLLDQFRMDEEAIREQAKLPLAV